MITIANLNAYFKSTIHQFNQNRPINFIDIVIFWRQFSTLLSAGLSLFQCCEALEKSQEKLALRLLLFSIKRELLSGKNFFNSLRYHKNYFDDITCQLIRIGEHTGNLEKILSIIANMQEKKLAFKKQIKQALFYPIMILFTAILITICMFIFVVPRFAELFNDMHAPLPFLTRIIFYLSAQLQEYLFIIFIFIFIISAFFYKKRLVLSKKIMLTLAQRTPLLRLYFHKLILTRFTRNLAITFAAGIPITEALKLTAGACEPSIYAMHIQHLAYKVSTGMQLHRSMQACHAFPHILIQMVKIGEESGMLDHMLDKAAHFFETEIEQQLGIICQILEPLIMVVLGVLIGGLVVGMYLPIFKLGSTF